MQTFLESILDQLIFQEDHPTIIHGEAHKSEIQSITPSYKSINERQVSCLIYATTAFQLFAKMLDFKVFVNKLVKIFREIKAEEMILQVQKINFDSTLNLPEAVGDYKVCIFKLNLFPFWRST